MISLQYLLASHRVEASAPCRIDSGGTWDIKAMALPLEGVGPTTVNVALNLRTFVVLSPYDDGWVRISSRGFPRGEAFRVDRLPFDSPFGLFFAAISYFGFHGLEVHINSQSPVKSALGGSSTAVVALIKALTKASIRSGGKRLSKSQILSLAYHLEDGISGGNCGLQDQAAAVYGGVHQWRWRYGRGNALVERHSLLDRKGQKELTLRLLVAYSGKGHSSSRINRNWLKDFLSGRTRPEWVKVNTIIHQLALAIKGQDWNGAARLLREEMGLRREITPQALIPITAKLVDQAERTGCGARFAGAGAGGSLWALGELEDIQELRKIWLKTLKPVKGARILDCQVDPSGAR
ncbi:MAG: galactokinase [Thermodesulfobacteriota bacterium]|nr:galactokinase [Thermodesulfobacteriota bacterium]